MPKECTTHHSQYLYHASAFGLAAEIERPVRQSITAQAATTLSMSGGRGTNSIEKFSADPFIYFDSAYSEVGGSFDPCHNIHTTYSYAVIEGLNIADIVTADRVVARMASYSPEIGDDESEHSFDITGSHYDNLRIAGHRVDIKLATHKFHQHDTYSKFAKAFHGGKADDLQPWGQDAKHVEKLLAAEKDYHALKGIGQRAKLWSRRKKTKPHEPGRNYWCSAAGHLNLEQKIGTSELQGLGGIILIPKFGVVHLAELIIHPDYRRLSMFRVQMCSTGTGTGTGGGVLGGGTRPPMP